MTPEEAEDKIIGRFAAWDRQELGARNPCTIAPIIQQCVEDATSELQAVVDKLRAAALKVVLAFPAEVPEGKDEIVFKMPSYIIRELGEAAKENDDVAL